MMRKAVRLVVPLTLSAVLVVQTACSDAPPASVDEPTTTTTTTTTTSTSTTTTTVPGAPSIAGRVVTESSGASWYVDRRSGRHAIRTTTVRDCITAQVGAAIAVEASEISALPVSEDAACVQAQLGQIVRHSDGDSYLVSIDRTRRWIPNSASYNCHIARGATVVNNVPRYYIDDLTAGVDYTTASSCSLILSHSDGDSHLIDASGVRHWIPSTDVYWCLAEKYPRFRTSDRSLVNQGWTETSRATCSM